MQAHFYCYLLRQNGVEISDTFTWIQLNKNGKRPVTHDFQFDENVLDRCIAEAVRYSELHHEGLTFD
jgi:hypothetical protein